MTILYLTFYFEPDLCAGSFRNTALVAELANQLSPDDSIHVVTTQPNRYQSFSAKAPDHERRGNITIDRITVPTHASGLADQIRSFLTYYRQAQRLTRGRSYDLVFASSSRLFTAFLGAGLARKRRAPLFLDIRDLFRETILEMLRNPLLRAMLSPVLWGVERYTFGYATHINLVSEGFLPYFKRFGQATYSFYTNGIDDEFINWLPTDRTPTGVRMVLYAGNIGEGQGLHKVIPQAARALGDGYRFIVIGDGGAKSKLEAAIEQEGVSNVELRRPISRAVLIAEYQAADYLFVHLNDLVAFERVLPSKLFEYGATDKPIIAGVAGYAARFIREHIPNSMLFSPGDTVTMVRLLRENSYKSQLRTEFTAQFGRRTIMQQMARQILTKLHTKTLSPTAV
ncbi:glycosyl transferase, group 1 family protein [Fibrisoma limi BUZ 3]|uniref:Glycosyl transferase, group 1 family protein n=1 Tax=Fibrisoma limi BUZ 3 TaxID=1185876 RepID=I2GCJ4_9BACT|nr:glycosyltransferase family 4 protein [Fibrisoma limi]CCH51618.1 glycosyl transferase, group 1 family protein [Fibrisoma limi BUZ 3]